jgi:hypothetical protein
MTRPKGRQSFFWTRNEHAQELADTGHLLPEELGFRKRLRDLYANGATLQADPKRLARTMGWPLSVIETNWHIIDEFFYIEAGLIGCKFIDEARSEAARKSELYRANRSKRSDGGSNENLRRGATVPAKGHNGAPLGAQPRSSCRSAVSPQGAFLPADAASPFADEPISPRFMREATE